MNKSGILVIDKPEGKSSAFISRICKKIIGASKVGHLGTLDPFATGVLPIAVNDATKIIQHINPKKKIYEFEIVFGKQTNTADITGEIIKESRNIPSEEDLKLCLKNFIGKIYQVPHAFSAIKVDGKKSYELARKGESLEIKPRPIEIFDLKIIQQTDENTFKLEASVSKGTYIRSLAEDIAEKLETVGYVKSLRRTLDGKFGLDVSVSLDKIEEMRYNLKGVLYPLENVLDDIPVVFVSEHEAEELGNGRFIESDTQNLEVVSVLSENGFFAMCRVLDGILYPERIVRRTNV